MSNSGQMNSFANTIRAVVVYQRRKNTAVGGASALILEVDVAGLVGIIGDQQDVVLSVLCVVDVAVFSGCGAVATVHHIIARQLVAGISHVVERSPTVKVDVMGRSAVHVDVQIAWFIDSHEIECGIR